MSTAPTPPARSRMRRTVARLVLVGFVAVVAWQVWVHVGAWRGLKAGREALQRDEPAEARRHLERCLEAWPHNGEANFLAAQAARRSGDLDAAEKYLREANRLGRPADDIEVEYALIKTQSGHFAEAESALLHHLNAEHPESPQILAIMVPACMAQFRWVEASELSTRWVRLCPERAPAWRAHAEIQERLRNTEAATDALRRLVELSPDDRKGRLDLARLILETRQTPDEAAGHAEWLTRTDSGDAAAQVQLAACREAQARTGEAFAILDRVLAHHPANSKALYLRGRLALSRNAAEALPFLRKAAELDPSDPDALYALFLCLQRAGTPEQAAGAEARWRQCSDDLKRVRDLGRAISAAPHDPELRREIGELFLRNGRELEGVRWLESALRESPDHAPTHKALAAYYDRTKQTRRAEYHRSFLPAPAPARARP